MRLSDLQNKDVVDISSGNRIGNVIDVEISSNTGNVMKIIVYDKKGLFNTPFPRPVYTTVCTNPHTVVFYLRHQ